MTMNRRWSITDARLTRRSGTFTLDEAARLLQNSGPEIQVRCPECGTAMWDASGSRPSGQVWLVRCTSCGRGLVFDQPRHAQ
jgi:hypothetical protein